MFFQSSYSELSFVSSKVSNFDVSIEYAGRNAIRASVRVPLVITSSRVEYVLTLLGISNNVLRFSISGTGFGSSLALRVGGTAWTIGKFVHKLFGGQDSITIRSGILTVYLNTFIPKKFRFFSLDTIQFATNKVTANVGMKTNDNPRLISRIFS